MFTVAPDVIEPPDTFNVLSLSTLTFAVDEIEPSDNVKSLPGVVPPTITFPPDILSFSLFKSKPFPVINVSPPVCVNVPNSLFSAESRFNFPDDISKLPSIVSSLSKVKLPPVKLIVLP